MEEFTSCAVTGKAFDGLDAKAPAMIEIELDGRTVAHTRFAASPVFDTLDGAALRQVDGPMRRSGARAAITRLGNKGDWFRKPDPLPGSVPAIEPECPFGNRADFQQTGLCSRVTA